MKNLEKLTKEMAIKEVVDIRNIASDDETAHSNEVSSTLPVSSILEFGSKEWVDCCEQFFGGKPKMSNHD